MHYAFLTWLDKEKNRNFIKVAYKQKNFFIYSIFQNVKELFKSKENYNQSFPLGM